MLLNAFINRTFDGFQVYFAHDKTVLRMDLNGQNKEVLAVGTAVSGLDFHFTKNIFYWSDTKSRKVCI